MIRVLGRITIVEADVTELEVDAIVNAANTSLLGAAGSTARSTAAPTARNAGAAPLGIHQSRRQLAPRHAHRNAACSSASSVAWAPTWERADSTATRATRTS
jgi:hypothetical protein